MTAKEKEYASYIKEHINNVKISFYKYGEILCNLLSVKYKDMEDQILQHDISKYDQEEFDLYRKYFYPNTPKEKISDHEFNKAFLHHIHNNPHHWNYWVYYENKTSNFTVSPLLKHSNEIVVTAYDMPDNYIIEMICDWNGMSIKFGGTVYDWYDKNNYKMILSDTTKKKLSLLMEEIKNYDNKNI